jgi:O-antigen ligase
MFALFAVLALVNVLFMVQGRTGQVVILILAVFFLWNRQRGRALVISAIAVILLLVSVAFLPSSSLHQRFARGFAEFSEWQPGTPSSKTSSVGLRMEFYKNTLEIIRENPIWGVGTGDFANAYAAQIKNTGMMPTENPHNEYLMITVQLGVIGLGFFLLLFFKQWHLSISIPDAFEKAAARGLVLTIMGASMVSSTLIDHTEGLFYFWMSALLYASLNSEIRSYKI